MLVWQRFDHSFNMADRVHFTEQCSFPTDYYSLSSRMDYINFVAAGEFQPRINPKARVSAEVDPVECAERVEAMVSTAILHQEDIWAMLLDLFPADNTSGMDKPGNPKPCQNAAAIKWKLQNAMDWCRLAQCRLQGIIVANSSNTSNTSSQTRSIQSDAGDW